MKVVGIIAEYNPLHNGHVYHMNEAVSRSNADYCIVCMSGNFVQRGEIACADKYIRTKWALSAGADLVIELPPSYALSPAHNFACSGVKLLIDTGVLTHLSFGTECNDLDSLKRIAELESNESDALKKLISTELASGKSYPRAYFESVSALYGQSFAELLRTPNNVLAIEYLKALRNFAPDVTPVPVVRKGSAYNANETEGSFSSALSIRNALYDGNHAIESSVPPFVSEYFQNNPILPSTEKLNSMAIYALRRTDASGLATLPELTEGLENLFYKSLRHECDLNSVLEKVKSKRYTLAKLKRTCLHGLLGITSGICNEPGYIRILGFKKSAKPLLSEIAANCTLPLLIRSRDADKLSDDYLSSFSIDALSSDLFGYVSGRPVRKDYSGPIIL